MTLILTEQWCGIGWLMCWQKYLAVNQSMSPVDTVDLGASIAEQFGKAIGPVEKKLGKRAAYPSVD